MKERPILFQGAMVRALLAGTKTQTRRAINPQPDVGEGFGGSIRLRFKTRDGRLLLDEALESPKPHTYLGLCPYGQPGDRLWVKERGWMAASRTAFVPFAGNESTQAPRSPDGTPYRSWPSIHMPRWASRITLEIAGVRVERLQAINEADAAAEGVEEWGRGALSPDSQVADPSDKFRWLWDSINGAGPARWDANPWVWVMEFKRCEVLA